jgi:putative SOS response-associated peptidase YedK
MQPDLDIRPTTQQWVVRQEPESLAMDKLRWGLVPYWWSGSGCTQPAGSPLNGYTTARRW